MKKTLTDCFNCFELPSQVNILADIKFDTLSQSGIQGIILDLDNTIVSEDDNCLSPFAEEWIEQAKILGFKLFILSNSSRRYRVEYWSNRLGVPGIGGAKKPFPIGFLKALSHMQLQPSETLVVGDSQHTDRLGAYLVGCSSIQVASLPHPPRWWERILGRYLHTPYPSDAELWFADSMDYTQASSTLLQSAD
jgi:HAD superfamily phosphatase (TIGR01668 family)